MSGIDRLSIATETHAWQATGRTDLARRVRLARKHSALVRLLRVGIPLGAVAGLAVVTLLTWFNPLRAIANLPKVTGGNLVVSGTKITMEAPKLRGYTRDNRAYDITAEGATQDFLKPEIIELSGIKARIEMQDKGTVDVKAVAGIYNTKSELLTLTQYILLTSTSGYEGHLTEAVLDVKKGHMVSEKPVEVLMLEGVIKAKRLEVIDNGALIRFDGGVDMTVNAKPEGGKKAAR